MYRITIDRSLCSGFGSCAELAPTSSSSTAKASRRSASARATTRPSLDAASACPMAAISVIEERGGMTPAS